MKLHRLFRSVAGWAIASAVSTAFAAETQKSVAAPSAPRPAAAKSALPKLAMATVTAKPTLAAPVKPLAAPAKSAAPAVAPAKPATPPPAAKAVEPPKPVTAVVPGIPGTPPPLPKGLVLHYSFDQAEQKGAVVDRSGQNNNGQATGARWVEKGKLGGGFEFSGASHFVKVPSSPSLNPKQITLATWFRTFRCDGVLRRILEKHCGEGYALGIAGDTPGIPTRGKISVVIGGARHCSSDYVITDGTWHHAAATYDGQNVKLYIDAVEQKQVVAYNGQISDNADDLIVGLNVKNPTPQDPIQCFEGSLDELMIFNRALSADEIKTMVLGMDPNAGKPLFSKNQVAGRLRQLKLLFEEGLLTDEFYEAKVSECEAAGL